MGTSSGPPSAPHCRPRPAAAGSAIGTAITPQRPQRLSATRRLAALARHLHTQPASPRSEHEPLSPGPCAGTARTVAMVVGPAALGAAIGWLLGYRRGQRDAWLDEATRRAAAGEQTAEQRAAVAAAMKDKASRFARTGEQLRAAKVGQKRTQARKVEMVDWPPKPKDGDHLVGRDLYVPCAICRWLVVYGYILRVVTG